MSKFILAEVIFWLRFIPSSQYSELGLAWGSHLICKEISSLNFVPVWLLSSLCVDSWNNTLPTVY